jgi:hypothetical protein
MKERNRDDEQGSTLPAVRASLTPMPVANMGELIHVGQLLAQSGMFGITSAAAGFVVASTCHQQGISLLEFQRTYHIVEGRPSMRADAMLAEFRKRGGRYVMAENSAGRAAAKFEFEGNEYAFEFTIDDARRIGDAFKGDGKTLKHNWAKRPEDMLWARMVSRAVRRLCPEIVAGLYTPEEVQDFDDAAPRGGIPVVMPPEEAARRAKIVQAESAAAETVTVDAVDAPGTVLSFYICPDGFGDFSGHSWDEMDDATLETAMVAEGLDDGHREAIREVLEARNAKTEE